MQWHFNGIIDGFYMRDYKDFSTINDLAGCRSQYEIHEYPFRIFCKNRQSRKKS